MTAPAAQRLSPKALQGLRRQLDGTALLPGDDGFEESRHVWNAMIDRQPALIVRCANANDVVAAIRFGREEGFELGVKCGGHGVVGHAVPEGGLVIDLGPMNAVHIDPDARLARVQGGALLGDLDRASEAHGLATTAGNVSHTGVGGLTLGGGMGWLARQLGMACDNVVVFQVVTADGEVLTASDDRNADLAWGLRGGGGNFGVVTEFTFRLHPISHRVLTVDFFFPEAEGPAVVRGFRELLPDAPRMATPTAWVGTTGDWPFLPAELRGTRLVNAGYVWVGDPDEGRQLLPAYRGLGTPVAEVVDEISYLELQTGGDQSMRHGLRRYWKGNYLRELPDEAIDVFLERGAGAGSAGGDGRAQEADGLLPNGSFQAYGGAIGEVGAGDTAFSHRDAVLEFVSVASWEDPAEDEARIAAERRYGSSMERFSSGVYVNGLADEGASGVRHAYQAETLARLTALKDRYDPDNVFHLNHNIPPSSTDSR
jgi:FAD/FMN-containing dehydrogenase